MITRIPILLLIIITHLLINIVHSRTPLPPCDQIPKLLCCTDRVLQKCLAGCIDYLNAHCPQKLDQYGKISQLSDGNAQSSTSPSQLSDEETTSNSFDIKKSRHQKTLPELLEDAPTLPPLPPLRKPSPSPKQLATRIQQSKPTVVDEVIDDYHSQPSQHQHSDGERLRLVEEEPVFNRLPPATTIRSVTVAVGEEKFVEVKPKSTRSSKKPGGKMSADMAALDPQYPIAEVSDADLPSECGTERSKPPYAPCLGRKQVDELFLACCQQHVPGNCHSLCTYEHREHVAAEQLIQAVQTDKCDLKHLSRILYCANQNRDNRQCCEFLGLSAADLGVGSRCLRMCNVARSGDRINSLEKNDLVCLSNWNVIMYCTRAGLRTIN